MRAALIDRILASAASGPRAGAAASPDRLLVAFALLVVGAGVVWGLVYVAFGEIDAALPPLAFALIVALSLVAYRWHRRYAVMRDSLLVLMIPLPLLVQVALGGFAASGAVVMWSVIAVFEALVLSGARAAAAWLAVFLVELAAAALIDPMLSHSNQLPVEVVTAFFALNVGALSAIAFALLASFLVQRDRAMALLAADHDTIERQRGELRRFLSPQIADLITSPEGEALLKGHRREITVVFSDLRGFTAFSETAEPEEVIAVVRAYHAALGELIFEHGGTLEHFEGDGVMVFFNDPVPIEVPVLQAVRMTVAMRERMTALAEGWRKRGYELGFGAGIALGYATLGRIGFEGRYDYGAIGPVTNLASRLASEAKPGQILLSQRAFAQVEEQIEAVLAGELTVKGLSKPVPAYDVRALRPAVPA